MTISPASQLVVTIGSSHGDDRAAWEVGELMKSRSADVNIFRTAAPVDMIDRLDGITQLHIIDACVGDGPVGTLLRCEWRPSVDGPPDFFESLRASGTHDFGVPAVLELADRLGKMPEQCVVWGIVGRDFGPLDPLSGPVRSRLADIAGTIEKELIRARTQSRAGAAQSG